MISWQTLPDAFMQFGSAVMHVGGCRGGPEHQEHGRVSGAVSLPDVEQSLDRDGDSISSTAALFKLLLSATWHCASILFGIFVKTDYHGCVWRLCRSVHGSQPCPSPGHLSVFDGELPCSVTNLGCLDTQHIDQSNIAAAAKEIH